MTLRIGYKASAEQFGPRELVEYAVRAEEVGLLIGMDFLERYDWRLTFDQGVWAFPPGT